MKQLIKKMDTDDLSQKTHKAIMIEAEKFNHDLTIQFGLLSYQCKSEEEFINKSEMLINEMLNYNEDKMDELFFGNSPSKKEFHIVLKKIRETIKKLQTNV